MIKERSVLMKKVFLLFVCVGLLLSSPLAYAQSIKIGYFNLYRVMNESKRWAKERDAFVKKGTELKENLEKKGKELMLFKESVEKKAPMLSEEARREKEKEYQQKVKELDRLKQDSEAELQQLNKEMSERFMGNITQVLKKLGEEEKYTLILEAGLVAYAPEALDITDQVIKAFDAAKE
jgi:outer membrane protein